MNGDDKAGTKTGTGERKRAWKIFYNIHEW